MTYRSTYRRRSYPQAAGQVNRPNRRPGPCRTCGEEIPAGAGLLYRETSGAWSVVHRPREWAGSPASGQYTYGCPAETDRMNQAGNFGAESGPLSERTRIEQAAAIYQASAERRPARATYRRGRCEDAPCCGCCD